MCEVLDVAVAEVEGVVPGRVQEGTEGREPRLTAGPQVTEKPIVVLGSCCFCSASSSALPQSRQTNSHSAQTVSL